MYSVKPESLEEPVYSEYDSALKNKNLNLCGCDSKQRYDVYMYGKQVNLTLLHRGLMAAWTKANQGTYYII